MLSKWQITHIHPIHRENLVIIFSVISTGTVTTSERTHTSHTYKYKRASKIYSRELATSRQNTNVHNISNTIHHKMIYHFCIKQFADFFFPSILFVSFAVLSNIQLSSSPTSSSEKRKIPNLYIEAITLPYIMY